MKRFFCFMLCICLMLCGCQKGNTANFYYQRSAYQYGTQDGVFVAEERDITGNADDLSFLLALYLMGPHNADYKTPFAGKAKLLNVEKTNNILTLTFTDTSLFISDLEYTLSCACLAMTCMDLSDADCITIQSGDRILTLTSDVLTLYDSGIPETTTEGEST